MANPYFSGNIGSQETWDLRGFFVDYQRIAFYQFRLAREQDDYPTMLKILDEIHCEVFGRIKSKWGRTDKLYKKLREKLIFVANKHQPTWTKKNRDPESVDKIREAFNKLTEYLFYLIDKNELFGKRRREHGL